MTFDISDVLLMQLLYGLRLYILGSAILWYLFRKMTAGQIAWRLLLQLVSAYALSVVIWVFWPFPFFSDLQYSIHLPALIAEIVTVSVAVLIMKRRQIKHCCEQVWEALAHWGEKKDNLDS